jgi:hypothetical protein
VSGTVPSSPFRSPLYWAAFAAGLIWTVLLWTRAAPLASTLDDEIGHFLVARDSWVHPQLILNAWGRVGTTLTFMLPAALGLQVARVAALAMSAGVVLVATQIARLVGVRTLALVPVLLWFQPWFHSYANAVLTEIPFSLALAGAIWAALAGRLEIGSFLFGLLPLMRHEGIAVLGLWAVYLLYRRAWRALALAAAPELAYQTAYALVLERAPFSLYFHSATAGIYGHGGWLHYVLPLARSVGPPVGLLAILGLVAGRRNVRLLLVAAPYVLLVLLETAIFRFGLFSSGGNISFLVPVAAFAAVAAAAGTDVLIGYARRHEWRSRPRIASGAALAVVVAAVTIGYAFRTHPARADAAALPMRGAVRFLHARLIDPSRATATHVWFYELSGTRIPAGDGYHSPWSRPPDPQRLERGSVVVWDCFYSNRFGLRWRRLGLAGFHELARFGGGRVVVLERAALRGTALPRPRCRT